MVGIQIFGGGLAVGQFTEIVLAFVGIAVPIVAFLWEFVFVGRRRLGYRVQMDTPVTGEIESVFPVCCRSCGPRTTVLVRS